MRAENVLEGQHKWWVSGGAAVFTHLAVMLVLPDAPHGKALSRSVLSEFEVTTMTSARAHGAGAQHADAPASGTAGSRTPPRAARVLATRSARGSARAAQTGASAGALHTDESAARDPHAPGPLASTPTGRPAQVDEPPATAQAAGAPAGAQAPTGVQHARGSHPGDGVGWERGQGARGVASGQGGGRAPGLLAMHNPCTGYFPATASVDHGAVQIHVHVDATGHTRGARVLNEMPSGQEFGRAARACAAALRFVPASDRLGSPIAGEAKLELSFTRS